ncbi:hypothetical protein KM915_07035 [Cytobacillus oceanisediminis]|uniref:hypothetical protein n=1 Tax=Cytobacillus oceanisediminis TaxID=665099 RepID=UPI001C24B3C5|nr:hypothetical protein [Cytobacillus oceanisediminis]MBU8729808.1 hypothetical protein [Cytobacillus oceanisediminis]
MLTTSSYDQLKNAQMAIGNLKDAKPSIYRKFINIIKLTRQLQFGYQYMGALIMDEDPGKFNSTSKDDYVLSVYYREIEKLKTDKKFLDLQQFLITYKQLSYANISKLALGEKPEALVGPTIVR